MQCVHCDKLRIRKAPSAHVSAIRTSQRLRIEGSKALLIRAYDAILQPVHTVAGRNGRFAQQGDFRRVQPAAILLQHTLKIHGCHEYCEADDWYRAHDPVEVRRKSLRHSEAFAAS